MSAVLEPRVADLPAPEWGSDVIAAMLRRLGVEHVAINPGASFRGLHDSLVNYSGNQRPGLVLCNHEEVAVALAQGYAKAAGRPMGAIVHSNVGLLHASMGIFDAWCDRVPVYVMGATGPMDSTLRRPWIDWIHTCQGQGQVVRDYTKWEHQPSSVAAIPEAMLRAWRTMLTPPQGPVYLCFDAGLQEQRLGEAAVALPDPARYARPAPPAPDAGDLRRAARLLLEAEFPVILAGRCATVGESAEEAWGDLVDLAEGLGAAVLTDQKAPAAFPTDHYLHQAAPLQRGDPAFYEVLRRADVALALEWIDPAGTLAGAAAERGGAAAAGHDERGPRIVNVSLDDYAVGSWSADYQALAPSEVSLLTTPARALRLLAPLVRQYLKDEPAAARRATARRAAHRARRADLEARWAAERAAAWEARPIRPWRLAGELRRALGKRAADAVLARVPIAWPGQVWPLTRPGSSLGGDGGAGVGSGPGMAAGAALALRGSGRVPVAVLGDGDLLMASSALWTVAHHRLPLLLVVANNQTYLNDEEHQERVARTRGRPPENRWIGMRMDDPAVDFAGLARSLGVEGFGPVADPDALAPVFSQALRAVDEGRPSLVDVTVGRG